LVRALSFDNSSEHVQKTAEQNGPSLFDLQFIGWKKSVADTGEGYLHPLRGKE
jgi:hypothetical protein